MSSVKFFQGVVISILETFEIWCKIIYIKKYYFVKVLFFLQIFNHNLLTSNESSEKNIKEFDDNI